MFLMIEVPLYWPVYPAVALFSGPGEREKEREKKGGRERGRGRGREEGKESLNIK